MMVRIVRVGAGLLLGASGALMYAGSWQRWAGDCPWGVVEGGSCDVMQDHLYDFVAPSAPWEPVGDAAQLAGWSLLLLGLVLVLLPWALTGRRPGIYSAVALVAAVLAQIAVGVATLRSGIAGSVVSPVGGVLTIVVWYFVPPALVVRFAFASRGGWAVAAAVWLFFASPFVAGFSYAVGPYDTRPWWEAISGVLAATAGLCLLMAAAFGRRARAHERVDPTDSPAIEVHDSPSG
jgi:hypothetical protein